MQTKLNTAVGWGCRLREAARLFQQGLLLTSPRGTHVMPYTLCDITILFSAGDPVRGANLNVRVRLEKTPVPDPASFRIPRVTLRRK